MARTGSTTSRSKKNNSTTEPATEAVTTEANEEATVTTPTDTVESTEATDVTATAETTAETATEAKPEFDLTEFEAAVETALGDVDVSTGTVNKDQAEKVKAVFRTLEGGVKAKNAAKKSLNARLRSVVSAGDLVTAQGVMDLVDAVANAGSAPKAPAERAPVDPTEAFVQKLVLHNLAYNLVVADVPDEVDADAARDQASTKVGELTEQADALYAWTRADEETRGDAPEVNPLVTKAVRLAQGKVSGSRAASTGGGTTHEGPRGNTARHIQLVFKDQPVGTYMKVAEIAKANSEEYPDRKVSAGAITARLKSKTPIEGIEASDGPDGKLGAMKTAEVDLNK